MRVAGVDEAGRGCVIGPLVVAAALFREETLPALKEMGVKDSKKISPKKRERLAEEIKRHALDFRVFEIQPSVIDKVVFRSKPLRRLNYLETMVMAKLVRDLKPDIVYIDPPDVDSQRCADQVKSVIRFKLEVICETRADDK